MLPLSNVLCFFGRIVGNKESAHPEWISHRGYKAQWVENTHAAFRAAVEQGFAVLETDLHATADEHLILAHDPHFLRLARDPRPIATTKRSELSALKFHDGSRPLFFPEFMDEFRSQSWIFDIKPTTATRVIPLLAKWAAEQGRRDEILAKARFVLWSAADERALLEAFPGAICFAQEKECYRAGIAVISGLGILGSIRQGRIYSLTPKLGSLNLFRPDVVDAYRRRGAQTLAFLPTDEQEARRAIGAGFDFILTNGAIAGGE